MNIPVRMYSAIDEQDVHFHLLHTTDNGRIGYAKVCKKDGKPVPDDEVGRANEVSEGSQRAARRDQGEAEGRDASTFPPRRLRE